MNTTINNGRKILHDITGQIATFNMAIKILREKNNCNLDCSDLINQMDGKLREIVTTWTRVRTITGKKTNS